jgi:metal-sulfur cluster biosynthetic enzyme/nitrite reductase/ring-hydroxylating ferredoxin subunit
VTRTTSALLERVADREELADGARKSIFVDDLPALLVRLGDEYFAVEDTCTHDGQPLTDGAIVGGQIECPRHGARFDLRNGEALCMPATESILTFAVDVRPDGIYVGLRQDQASAPATPVAAPGSLPVAAAANATAAAAGAPVELDDAALIEALREVVDPELMINIVDLGLVYAVNRTEQKVQVEMTLTSPACPAGPQIVQQAKSAVERLPGVAEAQIKLTMSPPWTPDRMTDEARDQLGIF